MTECALTEPEDTPESRYEIRVQTPWSEEKWVHRRLKQLAQGSFGTVHETVNMHTRDHLAVKTIHPNPQQRYDARWKKMVKREVEILHKIFHPNLIEFRHCQGFRRDDPTIELFMMLHKGSVEVLLYQEPPFFTDELIKALFQQMLRAVVYLAHKGIVHRDIKPANILYTKDPEKGYVWCLTDFGLAKFEDQGLTRCGSGHFRAPEILSGGRQTHKADVYSLAMTMLVIVCLEDWRRKFRTDPQFRESVEFQNAVSQHPLLAPMLGMNPDLRPSAQQLYRTFFGEDPEIQAQPPAETQTPKRTTRSLFAIPPGAADGGNGDISMRGRKFT